MPAQLRGGWLTVPYDGHDLAIVHIAVGPRPEEWVPAFLDWSVGQRVAKIRPPLEAGKLVTVWFRVGATVTNVGKVVL